MLCCILQQSRPCEIAEPHNTTVMRGSLIIQVGHPATPLDAYNAYNLHRLPMCVHQADLDLLY